MKKLRLFALALLICAATAASATAVVTVTDGDALKAEFLLADSPQVSYADGALTVKAGDVTVAYPADKTYTFRITDASGIADAVNTRVEIASDGSNVSLSGLQAGAIVRLYDTAGCQLMAAQADEDGTLTLNLDNIHGVILISLADQSFKIIK